MKSLFGPDRPEPTHTTIRLHIPSVSQMDSDVLIFVPAAFTVQINGFHLYFNQIDR